jgi:DNA-binding CsgD family transcriptional regulator
MTPSVANKMFKMFKNNSFSSLKEATNLTERERDILKSLVEGMNYKMIAANCFISIDTVSGHIKDIYKKLLVHSKSEAVVKAIKGKLFKTRLIQYSRFALHHEDSVKAGFFLKNYESDSRPGYRTTF